MLPGNGLRHLVIEVRCVISKLLVNGLRHTVKCWLNAHYFPHDEEYIRENDCHSVKKRCNIAAACRVDELTDRGGQTDIHTSANVQTKMVVSGVFFCHMYT